MREIKKELSKSTEGTGQHLKKNKKKKEIMTFTLKTEKSTEDGRKKEKNKRIRV